jgi:hypothetical protein
MLRSATSSTNNRQSGPFRRVFGVAVTLLLLCVFGAAQQQTQAGATPDAPSAAKQSHATPADSTKSEDYGLLSKNSWFFPNIATSSGPLSPGQKLELAARNSISLAALVGAGVGAGVNQARNSPAGYGQGAEGYGKRFGAGMARNASSQVFGTFLLASALHQDPRFYVKGHLNFGESIKYSIRRVFITRSDSGEQVVNWSGLIGPAMAEGLANAYYPDSYNSAANTFSRYGYDLMWIAGANLLREYWPKINRKLNILPQRPTSPATGQPAKP